MTLREPATSGSGIALQDVAYTGDLSIDSGKAVADGGDSGHICCLLPAHLLELCFGDAQKTKLDSTSPDLALD